MVFVVLMLICCFTGLGHGDYVRPKTGRTIRDTGTSVDMKTLYRESTSCDEWYLEEHPPPLRDMEFPDIRKGEMLICERTHCTWTGTKFECKGDEHITKPWKCNPVRLSNPYWYNLMEERGLELPASHKSHYAGIVVIEHPSLVEWALTHSIQPRCYSIYRFMPDWGVRTFEEEDLDAMCNAACSDDNNKLIEYAKGVTMQDMERAFASFAPYMDSKEDCNDPTE